MLQGSLSWYATRISLSKKYQLTAHYEGKATKYQNITCVKYASINSSVLNITVKSNKHN